MENKIGFFQFIGEFLGIKQTDKEEKSEDDFILVDVEALSLDDDFLKYEPDVRNSIQRIKTTKKNIITAIKAGTKNFYRTKNDPSFIGETENITFISGKYPAVGKNYNWWEKAARDYAPERGSRLGTKNEYYAFLGVLIKKLIENGMSTKEAWIAVCDDSTDLGHYRNSKNAKHKFEDTGSREVCGFCDLANTCKILAWDSKIQRFWVFGGGYLANGLFYPLTSHGYRSNRNDNYNGSVGWVVLEK